MRTYFKSVLGGAAALAAVALLVAEIKVPAVGIDNSQSQVRGALGVSLEDLNLNNDFGKLSLLLYGGSALLSGAFACFAIAKYRRKALSDDGRQDHWRSGDALV
jgi:hypothetical protein